jgi:hypothetical protein
MLMQNQNNMPRQHEVELVTKAQKILEDAEIDYERIYIYAGCTIACGKMPRVVVRFKNETPMCFHLDELCMYVKYGNVWKLWIDDEAYDKKQPQRNAPNSYLVATSVNEAIKITNEQNSPPFFLNLDHDLGEGPKVMEYLKWLYDKYPDYCPNYTVHSENCVGSLNIISYIDSWRKSLDL